MRRFPSRISSASFPEFGVVPEGLFPVKLQGPPTVTSSQPAGSLAAFALTVACTRHGLPYRESGHQYTTFHVKHHRWAMSTTATGPRAIGRNRLDPTRRIHKTSALRPKSLICVSQAVSRETDPFKLWLTSKLGTSANEQPEESFVQSGRSRKSLLRVSRETPQDRYARRSLT